MSLVPPTSGLLEVLRRDIAPGASDDVLQYGVMVGQKLELDFHAGEITFMPFGTDYKVHITVAGRRSIAKRTGEWRGTEGPQWCDRDRNDAGEHVWLDVWDDPDRPPHAARCLTYVKDWIVPANGTCPWSEFSQWYTPKRGDQPRLVPTWAKMPAHMLGLRAESLSLRRAFPEIARALAAFDLGYDPDDGVMDNEAALEPAPIGEVTVAAPGPGPAKAGVSAPAPAAREQPRSRARADQVPEWVYDDLPEARGYTR